MRKLSKKAKRLIIDYSSAAADLTNKAIRPNFIQFGEARAALMDYIAELESAQRWASLEDPPKFDGRYLLRNIYGDVYSSKYVVKTETWVVHDFAMFTHWMPLPQPPEVK